jgi:probable 2-oxoglutarate dehydrogenase E1 component DHKTD1
MVFCGLNALENLVKKRNGGVWQEITEHLRKVYVGNIAYEVRFWSWYSALSFVDFDQYMHSPSKTERLWFFHLLESKFLPSPEDTPLLVINEEKKRRIHELLARSEVFDNFLQLKFPNLKRVNTLSSSFHELLLIPYIQYGLEGGESMLPALDSLFSSASQGIFNSTVWCQINSH